MILVIGDSCNDIFVYGDIERISPEAPIPVFVPTHTKEHSGMACNVTNNISGLGKSVSMISNKEDIIKKRYIDNRSGQMVLRVDEHDYCKRVDRKVLTDEYLKRYNAVIVSDYCKGFLEEDDIQFICENNDNVFVDTKKKLGSWIESAKFIKINELEYKKNHEVLSNGFENKLIVTLGSKGCRYNGKLFPVDEVLVKDVSGAGDTFLAGLVCGYLDTKDIEQAIDFAQKCSKVVVQKHGVVSVTLGELK
jgi:D-beta-D-heptose 7-phosphate kinase/D-beta-D-heptose 1-phosphate adenosyltransferase